MGETVSPRGTDSARLIRVIETKSARGKGTQEDLCRIVTQYWDLNGKLLAENDPQREEDYVTLNIGMTPAEWEEFEKTEIYKDVMEWIETKGKSL